MTKLEPQVCKLELQVWGIYGVLSLSSWFALDMLCLQILPKTAEKMLLQAD